MPAPTERPNPQDKLRAHTYDGIQEYDKRLPNWWLMTLYGTMLFGLGYWFWYQYPKPSSSGERVKKEMAQVAINAAKSSHGPLTDDQIWTMSRDKQVIAAGRNTFESTCASCHKPDLSGNIGPNLKVNIWLHGGLPHEVVNTITNGVPPKGMPTWGPVLGKAKINEVAAYVMSYHQPGEKIIISKTGKK
jgi:cytochrome c oxidase cbb3-type subunit III